MSQQTSNHHGHSHDHDHEHPQADDHHHHPGSGLGGWINTLFHRHGHSHQHSKLATDQAFLDNQEGIRTVWLALAALTITSLLQIVIVIWSGSVALLADTIHNIGDGLNSVPLLIAFYLVRRAATRRYTYGFGKAEDVAGIFIVLSIAVSAVVVFYESIQKFINPEPMTNLGWVAAAAVIGFLGNEAVALLQIRTGRKIGSAALVADGLHARTDGLTSLAVLLAAGGTWLGFAVLDPIIGFLIGVAILFITRDAIVRMWYRLMDAIEPEYMDQAEAAITGQPDVKALHRLRLRWIGHRLHAEVHIAVDPNLTTLESHQIAEQVRHELFHQLPTLSEAVVHVDPWMEHPEVAHKLTLHHESVPRPLA
ncbi:MAG TPA: cation diffusion facilitator family transporter [Anaerolineae bacterium]